MCSSDLIDRSIQELASYLPTSHGLIHRSVGAATAAAPHACTEWYGAAASPRGRRDGVLTEVTHRAAPVSIDSGKFGRKRPDSGEFHGGRSLAGAEY